MITQLEPPSSEGYSGGFRRRGSQEVAWSRSGGTFRFVPLPSTPLDRMSAADRAAGADRGVDRGALERSRLVVHPASARVVLEVLRRPDDSAGDLTKVILTDPALAAAVLRSANSAHLGYSRRIGGVRRATVMLGTGLVNSLAASRVADLVFDTEAPDYPDWLWLHSIATACAASVLARRVGEAPDEAYTAGLLHEVGWLLGAGAGVAHPEHDHAEIGGLLLSRWNLPDRITAAVRMHHARPDGLVAPLDRVVVAARSFAVALGATGPEHTLDSMEALQLLQLRNVRQPAVMQEIEAELAAVTSDLVGAR
ncbi:unannotated protein [freshwater metagenome]|uniref:Unannotated protein n=1 Tax=freshwater metagenome TaxID=449393 RepID=A0A6J6FMT9_9ZZZZ